MKEFESSAAIILAAGEGKRMKSKTPKVLHPVAGVPMLHHLLNLLAPFPFYKIVVVIGHQAEQVEKALLGRPVQTVLQATPRGTGDAVLKAQPLLAEFKGPVLILNGDTPLLQQTTLRSLWTAHKTGQAPLTLLTAELAHPTGYGRIIRNRDSAITRIVEEKDASPSERSISEVNCGTYLVESTFLFEALGKISPKNQQNEYYLTDIIEIAHVREVPIGGITANAQEVLGINSRADLAQAEAIFQRHIARRFMEAGVTLMDPARIRIDAGVSIGSDTTLYPDVTLEGETTIGEGCVLHACRIRNSKIGAGVLIRDQSVIEDAVIESDVTVGPFAHIRPGTILRKGSKVGNFVETKKCDLGEMSKANHLTYLGDTRVGKNVNIGAGTITCNYDGHHKYETVIEEDVFIGSDTQLVAPVTIGARSLVGAGSTITQNVPPDALALSRPEQKIVPGWAKKKRQKSMDKP